MLGLRDSVILGRDVRREVSVGGADAEEGFEICLVVRRSCLDFVVEGGAAEGEVAGGVGEHAFTRGFFAFLLRSFSSSSDDVVTSERLEQSTLIASELRIEIDPNDGAHFKGDPGG